MSGRMPVADVESSVSLGPTAPRGWRWTARDGHHHAHHRPGGCPHRYFSTL